MPLFGLLSGGGGGGGGGVHLALRPQKPDSLEGWYF